MELADWCVPAHDARSSTSTDPPDERKVGGCDSSADCADDARSSRSAAVSLAALRPVLSLALVLALVLVRTPARRRTDPLVLTLKPLTALALLILLRPPPPPFSSSTSHASSSEPEPSSSESSSVLRHPSRMGFVDAQLLDEPNAPGTDASETRRTTSSLSSC